MEANSLTSKNKLYEQLIVACMHATNVAFYIADTSGVSPDNLDGYDEKESEWQQFNPE